MTPARLLCYCSWGTFRSRVNTEPEKKLVEDRHAFLVIFLGELKKENKNDKRYYSTGFFIGACAV